jgi:hypothetical protein
LQDIAGSAVRAGVATHGWAALPAGRDGELACARVETGSSGHEHSYRRAAGPATAAAALAAVPTVAALAAVGSVVLSAAAAVEVSGSVGVAAAPALAARAAELTATPWAARSAPGRLEL